MEKEKTVRKIARPGPNTSHGERSRRFAAELIIEPQSGSGGCGPMPIKLSAANARIAVDAEIDAATIIGLAMFGRMCRIRMRSREAPSTDAAVTYSCSRACSV